MEAFLINIFFLARPIMFIESRWQLGGLNFFELLTLVFTGILGAIALNNAFSGKQKSLSDVEWALVLFIIWCTLISVMHPEYTSFKQYIKWVLPFVTYIVFKRAFTTQKQYQTALLWMIIGFSLPVFWSFVLVLQGKGLSMEIYWTGLQRYSGVYSGVHTMGHNMGFVLFSVVVYLTLKKNAHVPEERRVHWLFYVFFLLLVVAALYCLYKSGTRTVYVGLVLFVVLYLYFYSKKALVAFLFAGGLGLVAVSAIFETIFFDVVDVIEGKRELETAGSGRPFIWKHNLKIFSELSFDRKLTGVGIGNTVIGENNSVGSNRLDIDNVWNSHNDYLEVLMETGLIGLLIQLFIYIAIAKKILQMEDREKYVFLSLFFAILLMNLLSNSYISRFGLAQMLFMILPYIEIFGQKSQRINAK